MADSETAAAADPAFKPAVLIEADSFEYEDFCQPKIGDLEVAASENSQLKEHFGSLISFFSTIQKYMLLYFI